MKRRGRRGSIVVVVESKPGGVPCVRGGSFERGSGSLDVGSAYLIGWTRSSAIIIQEPHAFRHSLRHQLYADKFPILLKRADAEVNTLVGL